MYADWLAAVRSKLAGCHASHQQVRKVYATDISILDKIMPLVEISSKLISLILN